MSSSLTYIERVLINIFNFSARRSTSPIQQERLRKSLEKLEQYAKIQEESQDIRSAERKEQLKKWMAEKRAEKMEEYKKHIQDLREHEHKPFKPSPDTYKVFISSFIYCNIVIICNNLM